MVLTARLYIVFCVTPSAQTKQRKHSTPRLQADRFRLPPHPRPPPLHYTRPSPSGFPSSSSSLVLTGAKASSRGPKPDLSSGASAGPPPRGSGTGATSSSAPGKFALNKPKTPLQEKTPSAGVEATRPNPFSSPAQDAAANKSPLQEKSTAGFEAARPNPFSWTQDEAATSGHPKPPKAVATAGPFRSVNETRKPFSFHAQEENKDLEKSQTIADIIHSGARSGSLGDSPAGHPQDSVNPPAPAVEVTFTEAQLAERIEEVKSSHQRQMSEALAEQLKSFSKERAEVASVVETSFQAGARSVAAGPPAALEQRLGKIEASAAAASNIHSKLLAKLDEQSDALTRLGQELLDTKQQHQRQQQTQHQQPVQQSLVFPSAGAATGSASGLAFTAPPAPAASANNFSSVFTDSTTEEAVAAIVAEKAQEFLRSHGLVQPTTFTMVFDTAIEDKARFGVCEGVTVASSDPNFQATRNDQVYIGYSDAKGSFFKVPRYPRAEVWYPEYCVTNAWRSGTSSSAAGALWANEMRGYLRNNRVSEEKLIFFLSEIDCAKNLVVAMVKAGSDETTLGQTGRCQEKCITMVDGEPRMCLGPLRGCTCLCHTKPVPEPLSIEERDSQRILRGFARTTIEMWSALHDAVDGIMASLLSHLLPNDRAAHGAQALKDDIQRRRRFNEVDPRPSQPSMADLAGGHSEGSPRGHEPHASSCAQGNLQSGSESGRRPQNESGGCVVLPLPGGELQPVGGGADHPSRDQQRQGSEVNGSLCPSRGRSRRHGEGAEGLLRPPESHSVLPRPPVRGGEYVGLCGEPTPVPPLLDHTGGSRSGDFNGNIHPQGAPCRESAVLPEGPATRLAIGDGSRRRERCTPPPPQPPQGRCDAAQVPVLGPPLGGRRGNSLPDPETPLAVDEKDEGMRFYIPPANALGPRIPFLRISAPCSPEAMRSLAIHLKDVPICEITEIRKRARARGLRGEWEETFAIFASRQLFGLLRTHIPVRSVPQANMDRAEWDSLKRRGVFLPFTGRILGTLAVFFVPEWEKHRKRLITAPLTVNVLTKPGGRLLPTKINLPNLRDIEDFVAECAVAVSADIAWCFGHYELPKALRCFFVTRFGTELCSLATSPTGLRHMPAIAQLVLRILIPARDARPCGLRDIPYLDNMFGGHVCGSSRGLEELREFFDSFCSAAAACGFLLNDAEGVHLPPPFVARTDLEILGTRADLTRKTLALASK